MTSTQPQAALRDRPATRVVVWGAGSIGSRHARVLRDLVGHAPLVVPIRPRAAELAAAGFEASLDIAHALAPGGAVIVCTDTGRHLADATRALELGCDVLCEKPLAASIHGLAALEAAARRAARRVFVGCNLRFHAGLHRFRELLPKIGQVRSVRIECQSYLPDWRPGTDYRRCYSARAAEGGVLRDLIHELDYACWLFGRPAALAADLGNTGELRIESEEWAELHWSAPSGARVVIFLDYLTRSPRRRMQATGDHGELVWDAIANTVTLRLAGQPEEVIATPQERDAMYADQARAFLAALAGGDPGPLATFDDGAFAVALCDTARASARVRREVPVPDWRSA